MKKVSLKTKFVICTFVCLFFVIRGEKPYAG